MFKAVCPYTSQAVVVGQARNFVTMLICLDEDAIKGWAAGGPLDGKSYAEIVAAPETEKLIAGYIEELNGKLNRWETIKKFAILPRDLSIEARRDHPVHEDQAPQRGDQLRRADRQDVRGLPRPDLTTHRISGAGRASGARVSPRARPLSRARCRRA